MHQLKYITVHHNDALTLMVRLKGQTIRFPDEVLAKLEQLSEETDLSINKLVIKIVRGYLETDANLERALSPTNNDLMPLIASQISEMSNTIKQLDERIEKLEKKGKK